LARVSCGVGPHYLYRQIPEGEIAPFAFARIAAGAGNGVTTIFGGTTAAPVNSRIAAIVLKDAAGTLPSFTASGFALTAGASQSIRVQRPAGSSDGQYLMVMITFKATHTIIPNGTNHGTDTASMAKANFQELYKLFIDTARNRSKYPQFVKAFNPENTW
jgi:hypothetical protein